MAKQILNNGETGLVIRTKINDNFTEIYSLNTFTNDEKSKLAGVEVGATADQTGSEIKALYEAENDTNAFTDLEKAKLLTFEDGSGILSLIAPESFGAVGNGIADDTVPIQRAINRAKELGTGVILKGVKYKITKPLLLPTGTTIKGVSSEDDGTVIEKTTRTVWTTEEESTLYDTASYYNFDAVVIFVRLKTDTFGYTQMQSVLDMKLVGTITSFVDKDTNPNPWQSAIFAHIDSPKICIRNVNTAKVECGVNLKGAWMSTIEYCPFVFGQYFGIRIHSESQGINISCINTGGTHYAAYYIRGSHYSFLNSLHAEWIWGGVSYDLAYGAYVLNGCGTEIIENAPYFFKVSNATLVLTGGSSIVRNFTQNTNNESAMVAIFRIENGSHVTVNGYTAFTSDTGNETIHKGKLVDFYGNNNALHINGVFNTKPFEIQFSTGVENEVSYNGVHYQPNSDLVTLGDSRYNAYLGNKAPENVIGITHSTTLGLGCDNSPNIVNGNSMDWYPGFKAGDFIFNKYPNAQGIAGSVCLNTRSKVYTLQGTVQSASGTSIVLNSLKFVETDMANIGSVDASGIRRASDTATGETLYHYRKESELKAYDVNNTLLTRAVITNVDPDTKTVSVWFDTGYNASQWTNVAITKITVTGSPFSKSNIFAPVPLLLRGKTGARPESPLTGFCYFDTTIGMPVWWNGTTWITAQTGSEIKALYEAENDTNAFTDAEKTKLNDIQAGAEVNVQSDWNASSGDALILNKPTIPTTTNQLTNNSNFVASTSITTIVSLTQTEYNALTPNANTFYIIVEA